MSKTASSLSLRWHDRDVTYEKAVSGEVPTRLVIGLVSNVAFNGSRTLHPFNFKHYVLSEIAIYLDGQQQHVEANSALFRGESVYMRLQHAVLRYGQTEHGRGHRHLTWWLQNGYALYAFDLTTDLDKDDHFNMVKQGNLHLSIKFNVELPETVTVLAYEEFDNMIELDRNCNMLVDFGVWRRTRFAACCASSRSSMMSTASTFYRRIRTDCWCAIWIHYTTRSLGGDLRRRRHRGQMDN